MMVVTINKKADTIEGMFGYEDNPRQLPIDAVSNKKLGSLLALVTVLSDDMKVETTLFGLILVQTITGRELTDGVGSFLDYLNTYLNEDELVELAAKTVLLAQRSR